MDILITYFQKSTFITIFVLGWLSLYFILEFSILISRYIGLNGWQKKEQRALDNVLMGARITSTDSILRKCCSGKISQEKLKVGISMAEKDATSGLTWLSIIAATSPFIGLFGTVVSILDTFAKLGHSGGGGISVIAPAISEALIATGAGILVAIPAYTFNLILKRKAYEILNTLKRVSDVLLLSDNMHNNDFNRNFG